MATADTTNSYSTVAQAEVYFDARLHAGAWTGAEADDKERALIQATRILDSYVTWAEVPDKAAPPQTITDATCELALVLLSGDVQAKDDMEGIQQVSIAGMSITAATTAKRIIPAHIRLLIGEYGVIKGGTGSIELVRS